MVDLKKDSHTNTSYLHVAGKNDKSPLVYLIPGNPGICEYYTEYVEELSRLLPGYEIAVPSHQGYDLESPVGTLGDGEVVYLDQQIQHKIDFLHQLVTSPRDVIVLGHSVGAWMAQRVVSKTKQSSNVNTVFVGLLMPTVKDLAKSDRGLKLAWLAPLRVLVVLFAQLLYYLMPLNIARWLITRSMAQGTPPFAIDASVKLLQRPAITNQILGMAHEELTAIGPTAEPEEVAGFWETDQYKIWALFAQNDHWVSPKTRHQLYDTYSGLEGVDFENSLNPEVVHAFCLRGSAPTAIMTYEALKRNYKPTP